jgi:putative DNA primase/helicase
MAARDYDAVAERVDDGWSELPPPEAYVGDPEAGPSVAPQFGQRAAAGDKALSNADAVLGVQGNVILRNGPAHFGAKLTEDEIALEYATVRPNHRWVQGWGRWMIWTGNVWQPDSTLAVYDDIRTYMRDWSVVTDSPAMMRKSSTIAAVEHLARSDRRYAATVDQWDTDPWILNTPGGLVDLRTGTTSAHDTGAYCTLMTSAAPSPICVDGCPLWLSFLHDVTGGDGSLIEFLQRMLGYALTGQTTEHALFFAHGGGGNGKSTLLDTVASIMGKYAVNAPMEVFVASHGDRHPTELAMLRGARLVTAVETEEGRRWAESRIKALTGGDPITARFMRQDFFTFVPTFKLLVVGNHKPRLHAVDDAMRRRLHLIPFEARFTAENRDKDMPAKLRAEAPGILRWMIEGCLAWQRGGLNPPERVKTATEAYFANQDTMAEWRAERCETGPDYWEIPSRMFASWREYARAAEYPVGTQSTFVDRMEAAGFRQMRDRRRGRHWIGIRLIAQVESLSDWRDQGGA